MTARPLLSLWKGLCVPTPTTMREIAAQVAAEHGLSVGDLTGRSRLAHFVDARHEAMWRIRQVRRPDGRAAYTTTPIGRFFGRDHSTVIHACRRHEARLAGEMGRAA
ncbi:MAG: helix-turn-helix domain-containing protein [Pseudomonadota bacterium]